MVTDDQADDEKVTEEEEAAEDEDTIGSSTRSGAGVGAVLNNDQLQQLTTTTSTTATSAPPSPMKKWATMSDASFQISPVDVDGFEALPSQYAPEPIMPLAIRQSKRNRYKNILAKWDTRVRLLNVRCAFSDKTFTLEDAIGSHAFSLESSCL
jgi:hypothetical protein